MPPSSSLARLQRILVAGLVLLALAWLLAWWRTHPLTAAAGAVCIVFVHAWFLALEFVLVSRVNARDPAPMPTARQLVRAWWLETIDDVRVFGWRQPFVWSREPDHLPQGSDRAGIVFVHGFVCNRGFWAPWLRRARARGHAFVAVNLEPVFGSIDDYARTVDEAVERVARVTGRPPLLVCHSMGGLVARAWLRKCDGAHRIAHVVTIGTPHHGTWLARFSRVVNGHQMRIGGTWLRELGAPVAGVPFTCWYSNCDNVVFPASTATLEGADNRLLAGAGHIDLAFRGEVLDHTMALAAAL